MAETEKGVDMVAGMVAESALLNVSLRDFFAAFALAGLVAQTDRSMPTRTFAEEAYKCADAMLAQRVTKEN